MVANPAHGCRKGIVLLDDFQRLFVPLFGDKGNVALRTGISRAGSLAGTGALFGYGVSTRYGLGIGLVGGCPRGQAFVELAGDSNRAHLDTIVAGCAIF
jgi:hypothetical protein